MAPQLPWPGGVVAVCHSRVVAFQGLFPAGLPCFRLQIMLMKNRICTTATIRAEMVMPAFMVCADSGMKSVPPMAK
ncbi:hypothetical protein D3C83_92900 [compost metagenome]